MSLQFPFPSLKFQFGNVLIRNICCFYFLIKSRLPHTLKWLLLFLVFSIVCISLSVKNALQHKESNTFNKRCKKSHSWQNTWFGISVFPSSPVSLSIFLSSTDSHIIKCTLRTVWRRRRRTRKTHQHLCNNNEGLTAGYFPSNDDADTILIQRQKTDIIFRTNGN